MNGWDLLSWASVVALGPGALFVFVRFLRDLRQLIDGDGDAG
jgi:hypothetical protein